MDDWMEGANAWADGQANVGGRARKRGSDWVADVIRGPVTHTLWGRRVNHGGSVLGVGRGHRSAQDE